jgi:hypothetical protein
MAKLTMQFGSKQIPGLFSAKGRFALAFLPGSTAWSFGVKSLSFACPPHLAAGNPLQLVIIKLCVEFQLLARLHGAVAAPH